MKRLFVLAFFPIACSSAADTTSNGALDAGGADTTTADVGNDVVDAGSSSSDAADASPAIDSGGGDAGCAAAPKISMCTAGANVDLTTGDLADAMYWNGGYVLSGTHAIMRVQTNGTQITPWTDLPLSMGMFPKSANGIQLGANAMGIVAATRVSMFGSNQLDAEISVVDGSIKTLSGPFTPAQAVSYIGMTRDATGFAWGKSLGYFTPLKANGAPLGSGTFFSNPDSYPIVAVASGPGNFLAGEWFAGDACEFLAAFDSNGNAKGAFVGNLVPVDQEPNCALTAGLSMAHAEGHYLVSYARFQPQGRLGFTVVDDQTFTTNAWATNQTGAYGSNVSSDGCRFGIAWTVNTSPNGVSLQASFQMVDSSGAPLAPIVALGAVKSTVPVISVATPTGFVAIWQPANATGIVATPIECK